MCFFLEQVFFVWGEGVGGGEEEESCQLKDEIPVMLCPGGSQEAFC